MLEDKVSAKGSVNYVLKDKDGNIKVDFTDNLVVDTGLAYIASRMIGTSAAVMSHMAVGTNNTTVSGAQTALLGEIARVALTSAAIVTTNVSNDSVQYVATFPAGTGTGAITEAGLFNAASAGTMLARTIRAVINKESGDTLTITWKIRIS